MAGLGESGAASGAIRAGRAFVELFAKDNSVYRSLDRLQARFRQIGQFMMRVGATTAIAGGAALKPAVETFVAFDDAIRMAIASTSDGAKNFDKLREHALELGRTTSFTATKVAELMTELARGGFNSSEIVSMTGAVLDLARATGADATNSAGVLAAAIRQFGLDAKDATHVADTLAAGANLSFTSVEALGESLKMVGPVAKVMNQSLDDTVAILGLLANLGIRGTEAGTAMRRLLTGLGANAKDFMDVFGVASKDAAGNARPLVDVLDDVQRSVAGLGNADKAEKFEKLFGLLGITSAVAISENARGVRELRGEIDKSGGMAARLAKEMDAGLGGSFRRLKGAVEGVTISMGDALAPVLTTVADIFKLAAGHISTFVKHNRDLAATIAGVTVGVIAAGVAMAGLGVVVSAVAGGVGVFVSGFWLVVGAIGAILSPAGLAAAAITGIGIALVSRSKSGQEMFARIKSGLEEMAATFKTAWGGIVAAIAKGDLETAFETAGAAMKLEWAKVMAYWTEKWFDFRKIFLNDLIEFGYKIQGLATKIAGMWGKGEKDGENSTTTKIAASLGGGFAAYKLAQLGGKVGGLFQAGAGAPTGAKLAGGALRMGARFAGPIGLAASFLPWDKIYDELMQPVGGPKEEKNPANVPEQPRIFTLEELAENRRNREREATAKAAIDAAKQRVLDADAVFKAVMAKALAPGAEAAPGEVSSPSSPGRPPLPAPPPVPKLDIAQIKGAFAVPSARSQFGYADSFKDSTAKKQLDLLGKIVDGVAGLPAGLAARLAQAFKPR